MRKLTLGIVGFAILAVLVALGILVATANAQVSGPKPQRGEWLCWATNAEAECGTYGWHQRRPVALKVALDLCDKRCGKGCAEDYCEVLK